MKRIAARTQEHASNARAAHHLDARNAIVAEEQGDAAQNVGSHCVGHTDFAGTVTVRAVHEVRLVKTRAHALAGHLNHAEVRNLQRGGLGTIAAQIAFQARFNLAPVLGHAHIDQVVDDDSAQVAQAQLTGDFINGFTVGVVGVGFTIACTAALATVHIDGNHGFGLINHQRAARRQGHFARVNLLNLPFNAERFEDWRNAVVVQKPRRVDRRHHLQEGLCAREGAFAVHHDGVDAVVGDVADGSNQQIAFRVQGAGRAGGAHASLHGLPQTLQVDSVALQFSLGAIEAGSAQNESESCWQFKAVQDAAHFATLVFVFHLAADANLVHLRHHHQQSAGNRYVTRQGWALGADALLEDLHDDFLSALERFLNRWTIAARNLLADALGALFAGEVLRVQIADVQEAVLAFAEVDERRLDGGFHVHDAALIDVADVGGGVLALGKDLLEASIFKDGDAAFFPRDVVDHDQLAALGTGWRSLLSFFLTTATTAAAAALAAVFAGIGGCVTILVGSGGFRVFGVVIRIIIGFIIRLVFTLIV